MLLEVPWWARYQIAMEVVQWRGGREREVSPHREESEDLRAGSAHEQVELVTPPNAALASPPKPAHLLNNSHLRSRVSCPRLLFLFLCRGEDR